MPGSAQDFGTGGDARSHAAGADTGADAGAETGADAGADTGDARGSATANDRPTTVWARAALMTESTTLLVAGWGLAAAAIGAILGLAFGWVLLSVLLTVAGIAAFAAAMRWYGVRQGAHARVTRLLLGAPVAAAAVALVSGMSVGRVWASAPAPAPSPPQPLSAASDTAPTTSFTTLPTTLPTSSDGGPDDRWPALINTVAKSATAYGITLVVQKIGNEGCGTAIPCGYVTVTISNASSGVFEFGRYDQYSFYVSDGAGNPHVWNDWEPDTSCTGRFTINPDSAQVPVKFCFQEPFDIGSKPLSAGFRIEGRQYAVNAIPGVTPAPTTTPPTTTITTSPAPTASGTTSAQG